MNRLFHALEITAAHGAAGLTHEAHESMIHALHALITPDGGAAGLDGSSDPYYTLFNWLCLRALKTPYPRQSFCAYMHQHVQSPGAINVASARFLLIAEGVKLPSSSLSTLYALSKGELYQAFIHLLSLPQPPRYLTRIAKLMRLRSRYFENPRFLQQAPTPQLVAASLLADQLSTPCQALHIALQAHHLFSGGYSASQDAPPDLLSTALARFSLFAANQPLQAPSDLAFIESCWLDDALFGSSPTALQGDAEHTFYGLLALGTCRVLLETSCVLRLNQRS